GGGQLGVSSDPQGPERARALLRLLGHHRPLRPIMTEQAQALLLGADYYGTLAAVRCLGRHGVPVVVADDHRSARALWSRYAAAAVGPVAAGAGGAPPPLSDVSALLAWLVREGERSPGRMLYPTNDHLAWLFAAHCDDLAPWYALYQPFEPVVMTLLDKARLG